MKGTRSFSLTKKEVDERLLHSLKLSRESLASKKDIQAYLYKQEQVRMYRNIRDSTGLVKNGQTPPPDWQCKMSPKVRKLRPNFIEIARQNEITKENVRLHKSIVNILSTEQRRSRLRQRSTHQTSLMSTSSRASSRKGDSP
jgi:hypothetical protein